jgi:hypothetical protein
MLSDAVEERLWRFRFAHHLCWYFSDVYAMNAEAVSALALCVLPYGPEQMVRTPAG